MAKDDPDIWFEPRRYGLGVGLPVAPQGWALLLGYLALIVVIARFLGAGHPGLSGLILVAATGAVVAIAAQHTRGGFHWRWGGRDD